MFTGIVECIGEITALERRGDSAVLSVRAPGLADGLVHGASIAVDGVCLTVVGWRPPEPAVATPCSRSLRRHGRDARRARASARREPGDAVNLERAVRADARLDGHVVQGHVDGTGTVLARTPGDAWETVRFALPPELARFVAEKGSIAVDGVSLTVSAVGADYFEVGLIPETLRATTLGARRPGDPVNLEVDVLAKYVARLMEMTT